MSTEGWIFMVGFRVFDVGLLILWLVWFFRLRDDGEDGPGDDGGGGEGPGPRPGSRGPGGGLIRMPLGRVPRGGPRVREHSPLRPRPRRRGADPARPAPLPGRVRRPRPAAPVHRCC